MNKDDIQEFIKDIETIENIINHLVIIDSKHRWIKLKGKNVEVISFTKTIHQMFLFYFSKVFKKAQYIIKNYKTLDYGVLDSTFYAAENFTNSFFAFDESVIDLNKSDENCYMDVKAYQEIINQIKWARKTFNARKEMQTIQTSKIMRLFNEFSDLDKISFRLNNLEFIQIGDEGSVYSVPTGTEDADNVSNVDVVGGFWMSDILTPYSLWYEILHWAQDNGYEFLNAGREGSLGVIGAIPIDSKTPVTSIGYWDVIVWLNAFSEKLDTGICYFNTSDEPVKNSKHPIPVVYKERIGFRLATNAEWDMAARFNQETKNTGKIWELGTSFASGIGIDSTIEEFVIFKDNSSNQTQSVRSKKCNFLGIYDMVGNLNEYVYREDNRRYILIRGGSFKSNKEDLLLANCYLTPSFFQFESTPLNDVGFRIVTSIYHYDRPSV